MQETRRSGGVLSMRGYLVVNEPTYYQYLLPLFDLERLVIGDIPIPLSGRLGRKNIFRALRQVRLALTIVNRVRRFDGTCTLVCQSAHYSALIAARLLSLLGIRVRVYLFNFFVNTLTRNPLVRPLVKQLMRGSVGIYVNAPNEVEYFRALSPTIVVDYYPYCLGRVEGVDPAAEAQEDVVFAGGHTNRDYDTLVQAARLLPEQRFWILCSRATRIREHPPANVRIFTDVHWIEFHQRMVRSRVVVVPLDADIGSSGQMVALAAMQFGKVVVYTDYPGLSQYFEDGVTGISYPHHDARAMARSIEAGIDAAASGKMMGSLAQKAAETVFSRGAYERELNRGLASFMGLDVDRFVSPLPADAGPTGGSS